MIKLEEYLNGSKVNMNNGYRNHMCEHVTNERREIEETRQSQVKQLTPWGGFGCLC